MEIGTLVKVNIPYKLGEKRNGDKFKEGKVVGIYTNFILIEFGEKYKECFKPNEVIII